MLHLSSLRIQELILGVIAIWLTSKFYTRMRRSAVTTILRGPPSKSLLFGVARYIMAAEDPGAIYEAWAEQYGKVFAVPHMFGRKKIVICDLKAAAHYHARDTFTYTFSELEKKSINAFIGKGLISAVGEDHRRQRKALTPAFSNSEIRRHTSIFYDSAYKLKSIWENMLQENVDVIEVTSWMNHVALDSIGRAGFSHNFNCLDGERPAVVQVFDAMQNEKRSPIDIVLFFLQQIIPAVRRIPTRTHKNRNGYTAASTKIAHELIDRAKKEKEGGGAADNSIIGMLIKSESHNLADLRSTPEEIIAQMNVLIFAGFETSSTTLTWALIELCRQPKLQAKLRAELEHFQGKDPTWDQLMNTSTLPYLDAVVQETLRLHTPLNEIQRVAAEDDVLPLSQPLTTADGQTVSAVSIAKGTVVTSPINMFNRSQELWGPTAKEFVPERWLDLEQSDLKAKEITGYRHILSFSDGPRICIGRHFALAEVKAVLSVLIRNFTFEMPDGPDHKVFLHHGFLRRPRLDGSEGSKTPLRVRKVE